MLKSTPVTLEGKHVILRPPLTEDHDGLSEASEDREIWNNPSADFLHPKEMSKYLQELLTNSR